jgi:hypothetical protein
MNKLIVALWVKARRDKKEKGLSDPGLLFGD